MPLLPRGQALFQRSEFGLVDFLIDLFNQMMTTPTRRKIPLHFRVPSLFLKLREPVCQFPALWLGELLNGGFDRFHGHIPSLSFLTFFQLRTRPKLHRRVSRAGPGSWRRLRSNGSPRQYRRVTGGRANPAPAAGASTLP